MIVNLVYSFNRIFIGLLLILILTISYIFNFENILIILILFFSLYDLWKSNFISYLSLFFVVLTFFLLILNNHFLMDLKYFFILFLLFLVFISFFIKSFIKYFFPIIIILFLYFLLELSLIDRNLFYLCIVLSFINDTSAYFFGNFFKGPLILPSISPKKTWSGTSISFIISFSILLYLNFNIYLSVIISLSFFLGDIYFSFIKRISSLKDFSNILGSHGGVLDRLDSIFFITIIFNLINNF